MPLKQRLILAAGIAAGYLLIKFGALQALVLFLLVGAIPGTRHSIPPAIMLLALGSVIWFIVFRFAFVRSLRRRVTKTTRRSARRRFSRV